MVAPALFFVHPKKKKKKNKTKQRSQLLLTMIRDGLLGGRSKSVWGRLSLVYKKQYVLVQVNHVLFGVITIYIYIYNYKLEPHLFI